jgi:hypothetical protein
MVIKLCFLSKPHNLNKSLYRVAARTGAGAPFSICVNTSPALGFLVVYFSSFLTEVGLPSLLIGISPLSTCFLKVLI